MSYLSRSIILIIIFIAIAPLINTEEWYMPDSHLISDKQFITLVLQDKSSYKFVKYFSPNCGYCRYLKIVMDKLKHQKEWCFNVYDFNCMWYPQHCQENVRSGSFPYTAIHDGQGNIVEEIHGFYPEPVIRTIFDRIQESCLQMKNTDQSGQNDQNTIQNSLQAEIATEQVPQQQQQQIKEQIAQENNSIQQAEQQPAEDQQTQANETQDFQQQKEVILQEKKQEQMPNTQDKKQAIKQTIQIKDQSIKTNQIKQQIKQPNHQQLLKKIQHKISQKPIVKSQAKPQNQPPHETHQNSNILQPRIITQQAHVNHPPQIEVTSQASQNKYIKYLIYGSTMLIAIYYFHHINKGKEVITKQHIINEQHQEKKCILEHNNEIENDQSSQVQKILKEQSNLLANVLDQEL